MKIDIHVHPQFSDPQQGAPPARSGSRLDLVADPRCLPIAVDQTSQLYFRRGHVMMPLPEFIGQMDQAGIDRAVLLVPAIKGAPVRPMNEGVANMLRAFPDRFIGFAGFDPHTGPQAVEEIEYAVKELGYSGIKTVASTMGLDINDRTFTPCYAKAQELGVPVLVHTGSVMIKGTRVRHVHPLMVDDVAFDFPDLKIIIAHLGGWQYLDAIAMVVHHPNVFADISFWPLHPLYRDLVPWDLLEQAVPDRILLGSDYPAGQTPKEAAEAVMELPISDGFKEKILGKNAAALLGL